MDYERHCRNRKKRAASADGETTKSASSAKDSAESSCNFQTDTEATAAGDGSSRSSSTITSHDASKAHGTGNQSLEGSGDASHRLQDGSDEPPKQQQQQRSMQPKNAAKAAKQKKLLRKKSVQRCAESVPVSLKVCLQ